MKTIEINNWDLHLLFGYSDMEDLAECVLRDMEEYDLSNEDYWNVAYQCLDAKLIYTEDRWALIQYYSEPENPCNLADACDMFVDDLMRYIDSHIEDEDEE